MSDHDLDTLLDPTTFEDEMTLSAIAHFERNVADGLVDVADTLPIGDERRPGLVAAAQCWHHRSRTTEQLADAPYAAAISLLREAGMLDDPT